MIVQSWPGKALVLALFSVAIASCGNNSSVQPKKVDASALQAEARDPQVSAFYRARQWQPAWDRKSEQTLIAIIQGAPANGLNPSLFIKGALPTDATAREAALTKAALSYGSALAQGYADPKRISPVYTIERPNPNVAQGLAHALDGHRLEEWFASLPPQTDEYRALSQAHLRYLRAAGQTQAEAIPAGKAIKPGHRDPRMPAIVAALEANGYVGAVAPPQSARYQAALVGAVRSLQGDYGMKADGVIGPATIDALNSGTAGRARQLAIAMERLRWLDRNPPSTRIDVNTAATFLDYWRGGQHVDRRAVVVGEVDKQTPQIQANFSQLVANPKWRVPDSIAAKELATKGPGWLAANNFAMENGRYVQQSGPKNSLGLVKFDMQDSQQIYLHDTPAKALFGLPERHRSHGCVRVQNALQFAAMLADQDGVLDQLQKALAGNDESYVKLKTSIPVRLLYHTAFWDGSRVQFRPDIYGLDDDVAMALGLVRGGPRKPQQAHAGDVGP